MPRMTFGPLDYALIIAYFVAVMVAGLSWLRRGKTSEDYFLAGRTLTLPAFVATLVSTWYGGILGMGEYAYQSGVSVWVVLAAPYYVFAAIFAIWLAPRIREASLYTIPDKIAEAYGKVPAVTSAIFTYGLTNPDSSSSAGRCCRRCWWGWCCPRSMSTTGASVPMCGSISCNSS